MRLLPPLAVQTRFTAEVLVEYMDWVGVDQAVLLQAPFYGDKNDYVYSAVTKWPDRFIGAGMIDPFLPFAQKTFRHLVDDLGFRVLKFELSETTGLAGLYKDLNLRDARLQWLWECADDLALTVTLDLGAIGNRAYQTAEVKWLTKTYARIRWIIAHLGQPSPSARYEPDLAAAWTEQIALAGQPNVWLDLASLPSYFPEEEYPYPSIGYFLTKAIALLGTGKLLWGTDVPGMLARLTYRQLRDVFLYHLAGFGQSEKDQIFGNNARMAYGPPG